MHCRARHVVRFECVCGKGLRTCVARAKKCMCAGVECLVRCRLFGLYVHRLWLVLVMDEYWLMCVCVHGSLGSNEIGDVGSAAIAGALQHVPSLRQLEYVVGEGARHEVVGCVG